VQQACTIIQSAAHEDANIIFGAVLDEKMKDAVKITVIATGFREIPRMQRRAETRSSFASTHEEAMEFPQSAQSMQPEFEEAAEDHMMEEVRMEESTPVAATHAGADVISLDAMRSAMVANFEQADLDVPAFLRKRGEVM